MLIYTDRAVHRWSTGTAQSLVLEEAATYAAAGIFSLGLFGEACEVVVVESWWFRCTAEAVDALVRVKGESLEAQLTFLRDGLGGWDLLCSASCVMFGLGLVCQGVWRLTCKYWFDLGLQSVFRR